LCGLASNRQFASCNGHSFSGIYFSKDSGANWDNLRQGIPGEPAASPAELEEVRSLCFGDEDSVLYGGLANGQGLIRVNTEKAMAERIMQKELVTYPNGDFYSIDQVHCYRGQLLAVTNRGKNFISAVHRQQ